MQTKTKSIIIVLILLASIFLIIFMINAKKKEVQSVQQEEETSKIVQPTKTEESNSPQEFSTVFVEGEVVSFENNELEIQNGEIKNKLPLNEDVNVYAKGEEGIVKKEISELKKGTKVRAEIDTKNSMVIAVEIL